MDESCHTHIVDTESLSERGEEPALFGVFDGHGGARVSEVRERVIIHMCVCHDLFICVCAAHSDLFICVRAADSQICEV